MIKLIKENLAEKIRQQISFLRNKLDDNKKHRKKLMKKISDKKRSIRVGHKVISQIKSAGLDCDWYVHSQVFKHVMEMYELKKELMSVELEREIDISKFRVLHKQLDDMKIPFDPEAKRKRDEIRSIKKKDLK
jgi:hypothetical protein